MRNKNKGFTLIEVIIVLALIGIILSTAFSMNIFGIKTYAKGTNRYDLNSKTNLASEYITKYIRFAYGVEILDASYTIPDSITIASSSSTKDSYIYLSNVSGKDIINYRDKDSTRVLGEFDSCSLLFIPIESDKSLSFKITTSIKDENFYVDSGIVPINLLIQSNPKILDTTGLADGVALKITNQGPSSTSTGVLTFVTVDPPVGTVNSTYTGGYNLVASEGTPTYTFLLSVGSRLPYGMSLSGSGNLGGTPIESGVFTVGVQVFDSSTPTKSATNIFNITINNNVSVNLSAPVATSVKITGPQSIITEGSASVGSLLTLDYDYYDAEGELEENSLITWWRGDNFNGIGMSLISGATTKNYTATNEDINKYIFANVTPASKDLSEGYGTTVFGITPVRIIIGGANSKPTAKDVTISKSDNIITGSYIYSDADGDAEGSSTFKWYYDNKEDGSSKIVISGASGKTLSIASNEYNNKYIFFEVTPVASSGNLIGDSVMNSNIYKN